MSAVREIERRWPTIGARLIDRIAAGYLIDKGDRPESPGDAQRLLVEVADMARRLSRRLHNLPLRADDAVRRGARRSGHPDIKAQTLNALHELEKAVAEGAACMPKRGRKESGRRELIDDLVDAVTAAGLTADDRESGPLVQLVAIVLSACGESVGPRDVARNELRKLGK
jgi:hypothetical protein